MTWLGDNAVALAALVIASVTASIQVAKWHAGKHRVEVTARSSTVAVAVGDGTATNHTYVSLTITNTGRPVSVCAVSFLQVEDSGHPQGPSWSNVDGDIQSIVAFEPLPSLFTPATYIADGETHRWNFSLHALPLERPPWNGDEFVATVELSNGRTVRSNTFWHAQSPEGGWKADAPADAAEVTE